MLREWFSPCFVLKNYSFYCSEPLPKRGNYEESRNRDATPGEIHFRRIRRLQRKRRGREALHGEYQPEFACQSDCCSVALCRVVIVQDFDLPVSR